MTRWAMISGSDTDDIAACVKAVAARLTEGGVLVGGFVQQRRVGPEDLRQYDVVRLGSGERALLAEDRVRPAGAEAGAGCSLHFLGAGFEIAARWVDEDAARVKALFLDGVSKLELDGEGHAPALGRALRSAAPLVIIGARARHLAAIVDRFELEEANFLSSLEAPASEADLTAFVEAVRASSSGA